MKSNINKMHLYTITRYVHQLKMYLEFVLIYGHRILFQFACIGKQTVMLVYYFYTTNYSIKQGLEKHHFCFDGPNFFVISLN